MLGEESIKKIYGAQSGIYDFLFKKFFYPRSHHVIKEMRFQPDQKILDVGVGTGLSLSSYPRHCEVVGIDLSKEMLNQAKQKVEENRLDHVTLHEMDASELRFPDNTFDCVIATFVISVVPDPIKVIAEMKRVCKKEGTIIIVNHFRSPNRLVGWAEKIINPITCKIGWRSDLCLNELIGKADLQIDKKYSLNKIDLWKVIFAANNKPC